MVSPLPHRIGSAGLVLAALVAFGSGVAQAAPQALALVATKGKVGLACAGGECGAELSSFCLDAGRFSPPRGTPYHLAGGGEILLTGRTADGGSLTVDARPHLRFVSARRHLAVRVSLDRAALASLGLRDAEIEVKEEVALLPAETPGDSNPITAGEAELFSGPLRRLGAHVVDHDAERMAAARVTSRLINLLPQSSAAEREALWRRATSTGTAETLSPAARKRARGAFDLCRYVGKVGGSSGLRRCLQDQHDGFIEFLNSKYWEAVKTGT